MSDLLAAEVTLAVLAAAVFVSAVRLLRGPTLADRVVVIDLVGSLAIGLAGAAAVVTGSPVLLDVGLIVALVTFLGTVGFARYLEGKDW